MLKKKTKNSRYSMRAFAKLVDVNQSTLSRIFTNKRTLTFDLAAKMLQALDVPDHLRHSLLLSLSSPENYTETQENYIELSDEEFEATAKWEFRAIAASIKIAKIAHTSLSIADFLGIPHEKALVCITILEKCKVINIDHEKRITLNIFGVSNIKTNHKLITLPQKEHIKLALDYIDQKVTGEYFYSGCTLAVPSQKMPEIHRRFMDFIKGESQWIEQHHKEENDRVYRLNIQFFPLNKRM